MEFAEKGDLSSVLETHKRNRTKMSEKQMWSYLIQMTRGLKVLHEMKICHRDLKSANVFITSENVIKLGDMNVSKIASQGLMKTQTGTPYYCSPEIWKGQTYDFKSDIWSLGCVVYELAMLKPPFTALDMKGLSDKACRGIYPAVRGYSKSFTETLSKMLQVIPSKRPSSFELLDSTEFDMNMGKTCAGLVQDNMSKDLLATILMPRNINQLANRLPRPKYSGGKLKRMNSEPARLPSVDRSRSRLGSASSRKQWELENPTNKFVPRSVINTKKNDENYHLNKKTGSNRYYSKDNNDRGVLQRAASNVLPPRNSRVINFNRNSSNGQGVGKNFTT